MTNSLEKLEKRISELEARISNPIYPISKCPQCGFEPGTQIPTDPKQQKFANGRGVALVRQQCTSENCDYEWEVPVPFNGTP